MENLCQKMENSSISDNQNYEDDLVSCFETIRTRTPEEEYENLCSVFKELSQNCKNVDQFLLERIRVLVNTYLKHIDFTTSINYSTNINHKNKMLNIYNNLMIIQNRIKSNDVNNVQFIELVLLTFNSMILLVNEVEEQHEYSYFQNN